jgi:hypothetical protein
VTMGLSSEMPLLMSFALSRRLISSFLPPRVTQQNGVVKQKNHTLVEMARTMLNEHMTPMRFWADAISTACYISNRLFLRSILHLTPFKLRFGRKTSVSHFRPFGCKCFILKCDNLDKFESRSFDGILLGYTPHGRSYRVYNLETNTVVESCDVTFNKTAHCPRGVFECACDKKMEESIFVNEGLQDIDGDKDEPLLPSTSSPSLFLLPHLKQRLLRLPPPLQQQWRRAVTRAVAGVGDLVQRTGDGRTGRVLGGWAVERSGGTVCGLHRARGDEERELLG